jgi:hypothetical protein
MHESSTKIHCLVSHMCPGSQNERRGVGAMHWKITEITHRTYGMIVRIFDPGSLAIGALTLASWLSALAFSPLRNGVDP